MENPFGRMENVAVTEFDEWKNEKKNTKFFLWFLIFSCLLLRAMRLLHCVCDGYMSYLRRLQ